MTKIKTEPEFDISDKPDLTLSEAKAEHITLTAKLNDGTLWAGSVVNAVEQRLGYLRRAITNIVCLQGDGLGKSKVQGALGVIYSFVHMGKKSGYRLNIVHLGDEGVKVELVHESEDVASVILPSPEALKLKCIFNRFL